MTIESDNEELMQALSASWAAYEKECAELLALATELSITENPSKTVVQAQQAQRLEALQEKASLAFLAREHDQKQKEEEAATQRILAEEQATQLQGDMELALYLTAHPETKIDDEFFAHRAAIKKMLGHVPLEKQEQFLQTLAPILSSPAVIGEYPNGGAGLPVAALTNAHTYTCTLIRQGIPILKAIDEVLRPIDATLNPDMPAQAVLADILNEVQKNYANASTNLQAELARIQPIHITASIQLFIASGNPVDIAETHANVQQLLSRTWTLAKLLGPDYTGAVACALSDNIADQGGCIPGLVARLYPIYAKMIQSILNLSIEPLPNMPTVKMHFC